MRCSITFSITQSNRGLLRGGQVDPAFFHALSKKDCLFHHDGGSWMLVHSRHPELLHAIHRGDAFLTRLEGEWWISFLSWLSCRECAVNFYTAPRVFGRRFV